jgi:hypothetical protein
MAKSGGRSRRRACRTCRSSRTSRRTSGAKASFCLGVEILLATTGRFGSIKSGLSHHWWRVRAHGPTLNRSRSRLVPRDSGIFKAAGRIFFEPLGFCAFGGELAAQSLPAISPWFRSHIAFRRPPGLDYLTKAESELLRPLPDGSLDVVTVRAGTD